MILLTVDEIQVLHSKLIQKTGGLDGLRDFGLLESAVYSANNSFGEIPHPRGKGRTAGLRHRE